MDKEELRDILKRIIDAYIDGENIVAEELKRYLYSQMEASPATDKGRSLSKNNILSLDKEEMRLEDIISKKGLVIKGYNVDQCVKRNDYIEFQSPILKTHRFSY